MWEMIFFLWSVPLAFGIVVLARLADGNPPLTDKERQVLFGDTEERTWPPWLVVGFVALAVVFFAIGFFEGLVVANLGSFLMVATPLITGLAAIVLLAGCLRSASSGHRVAARNTVSSRARDGLQAIRERLKSRHLPS